MWHLQGGSPCKKAIGIHPSIQIIPIMENQMEQEMENEMETGVIKGLYRGLRKIILTLGPKACTYYLHWAI